MDERVAAQLDGLRKSGSYGRLDRTAQRVMEAHLVATLTGGDDPTGRRAARQTRTVVGRDAWRHYRNAVAEPRRRVLALLANRRSAAAHQPADD